MARTGDTQDLLDHALGYAARGWPVLPLHTIIRHPQGYACSCGRRPCPSPGKHPRLDGGVHAATVDEETIRGWWSRGRFPDANIGIATGRPSGLVVLDVDPDHGGDESLADLVHAHGPIPETLCQLTGGGGVHYLFGYPDCSVAERLGVGSRAGWRPGLDIRGDGGYIVVEPSRHITGKRYLWAADGDPDTAPLASLPGWLETRAAVVRPVSGDDDVVEGYRNQWLTGLAGALRRRGHGPLQILAVLAVINEGWCRPPLPAEELAHIARSVGRYAPHSQPQPERNGFGRLTTGGVIQTGRLAAALGEDA